MPYKSRSQAGKFHELEKEGKISSETVAEFDKASKGLKLPERIKPKAKKPIRKIKQLRKLSE